MDSLSEVRRVRKIMSEKAGHDIRKLIANINSIACEDQPEGRVINPGENAEQCSTHGKIETKTA